MDNQPKYKRIVLKLSGEALSNGKNIFDFSMISRVAGVLKKCREAGVEIAVIVGAGNIWRGRSGGKMNRVRADSMGMLATVINALALQDTFIQEGLDTVVMTAVEMEAYAERYTPRKAAEALENGKTVIFGCGLGAPFFSTDTPAVVRAAEIGADAVLLAKNVDGLYDDDPRVNPNAKFIRDITLNLSAENLHIWKKYNGFDPDVSTDSSDSALRRVDLGAYPKPRTIVFSIQLRY